MPDRAFRTGPHPGSWSARGRGPARTARRVRRVDVAIAVGEDAIQRIDEVAVRCQEIGFRCAGTLAGIGIFTGSIEWRALAQLRSIPGVLAVVPKRRSRDRWPSARH